MINLEDLIEVDPNISVIIKNDSLKEIKNKILSNCSIRQFSKIVDCSPSFLSNLLNNRIKSCKFIFIQKVTKILNLKPNEIIEKVISRCRLNCFIPIEAFPIKKSPIMANLVGHAFGDGHIGPISFAYSNKNRNLIDDVISNAKKLSVNNVTYNSRYHKATNIQFSKLVRNILILAGSPIGRKTSQILKVPVWIKKGSRKIKKSFIQAIFDDEATVSIGSREIVLGMKKTSEIVNSLVDFFEEIKCMLKEFKIKNVAITNGSDYVKKDGEITKEKRLRICGASNFINFKDKIDFIHPLKIQKLNKLIAISIDSKMKIHRTKIKIVKLLEENKKLSTSILAKKIGLGRRTTADRLRELEKLKVVDRIRVKNKAKPHIWFLDKPKNFNPIV